MKKVFTLITALVVILSISTLSYAVTNDQYHFELNYQGEVIENEPKNAKVLLVGVDGQLYTNALIKVSISGPATPKIIAYDSAGTEFDIAQIGYWGPSSGFPVQGTFTNETPVIVTYPQAGTYTTTLQLVDVSNNNAVIASNEFTINVLSANADDENNGFEDEGLVPNENTVDENIVEELPQAGINLLKCAIYLLIISVVFFVILKKKNK